jgi:hypothetical protein
LSFGKKRLALILSNANRTRHENSESTVTEKLKRFNEAYSLLFVVVTILLTVGATSFEKIDLSATVSFILVSLVAWIFGHLLGANQSFRHVEIQFKLTARLYASLLV